MPNSRRRDLLKTVGSVAVIGTLAGCAQDEPIDGVSEYPGRQSDTNPQQNETTTTTGTAVSLFRVVHAAPDLPDVDVYFDNQKPATDLNFDDVTPYFEVVPDRYRLAVTEENDERALLTREITAAVGTTTTAVAYGERTIGTDTEFGVDLFEDDLSYPGRDRARVRLFHASPDTPPISVFVTRPPDAITPNQQDATNDEPSPANSPVAASPLFEELRFGEAATIELLAGEYTLGVFPAGADRHGTAIATTELEAKTGGVYSLFAVGYRNPSAVAADEAFEVLTVEDAVDGERSTDGTQ